MRIKSPINATTAVAVDNWGPLSHRYSLIRSHQTQSELFIVEKSEENISQEVQVTVLKINSK